MKQETFYYYENTLSLNNKEGILRFLATEQAKKDYYNLAVLEIGSKYGRQIKKQTAMKMEIKGKTLIKKFRNIRGENINGSKQSKKKLVQTFQCKQIYKLKNAKSFLAELEKNKKVNLTLVKRLILNFQKQQTKL